MTFTDELKAAQGEQTLATKARDRKDAAKEKKILASINRAQRRNWPPSKTK
jgi:hypothetical protein